jgi:NAD(P)-dependent dehydrogenase (short-subunit alcohol dehydrogenase family)
MNRLKDKRALITGGTTGIGLEELQIDCGMGTL